MWAVFGAIQSPRHRCLVPRKRSISIQISTLLLWQLDTSWETLGHLKWHYVPTLRKMLSPPLSLQVNKINGKNI